MFSAKELAVVVIILEAYLGKLTRIKSEVWRDPRSLSAKDIVGIVSTIIAVCPFPAQTGNPTRFESPQHLRIQTPIPQGLCRESRRGVRAGFETLIERLRL